MCRLAVFTRGNLLLTLALPLALVVSLCPPARSLGPGLSPASPPVGTAAPSGGGAPPGSRNIPPVAHFTATPASGYAPLTVSFDASGSFDVDGTVTEYRWDWEDDGTVDLSGPDPTASLSFLSPGDYTVRLVVVDDRGATGNYASEPPVSVRKRRPQTTTTTTTTRPVVEPLPNRPPLAGALVTPLSGPAPLLVTFDGSHSSDADGHITSYDWLYGDGSTGSGADATHVYATAGIFLFTLTVQDDDGASASVSGFVSVLSAPPQAALSATPSSGEAPLPVTFDAGASTDPDGGTIVEYAFDVDGDGTPEHSGPDPVYETTYETTGSRTAKVTVRDDEGETAGAGATVVVCGIPEIRAPGIDRTVATTVYAATRFLYTGDDPVQRNDDCTPINLEVIEPRRAAVIRGRVLDTSRAPLPGVRVSVKGHDEYGMTRTRADGQWDLVVNGGSSLTVEFEGDDRLPAQRHVTVGWQEYCVVPDIALTVPDAGHEVEQNAATWRSVRSSPVGEAERTRRVSLLFQPGTSAVGIDDPSITVRATEYTVEDDGEAAMPASLPASSGYTFAAELGVDEAGEGGHVTFDKDVAVYVDNFLAFPIGDGAGNPAAVPVGYYDPDSASWAAMTDGMVLGVLDPALDGDADGDGVAEAALDVDGDGATETPEELLLLGATGRYGTMVTTDEQEELRRLYPGTASLWRFTTSHFSTYDCNWPLTWDESNESPGSSGDGGDEGDCPSLTAGSIIECETQVLRESLPVTGTDHTLNYSSDRVPGRTAENVLKIPATPADWGDPDDPGDDTAVPSGLVYVEVEVEVAGRTYRYGYGSEAEVAAIDAEHVADVGSGQTLTFDEWDGTDAYGQAVNGSQAATVRVSYAYSATYAAPDAEVSNSFALYSGSGQTLGMDSRSNVLLSASWEQPVGHWSAPPEDLGGWSLGARHAYDPTARRIHFGDGSRRNASSVGTAITTFAGTGDSGYPDTDGDGVVDDEGLPATSALLNRPGGVAVAADGSVFVLDVHRVRRVAPDGTITTVAGSGVSGEDGDGGPATEAELHNPGGIAVAPDASPYAGSVFVADTDNSRIRRIRPDGIIETFAGNGTVCPQNTDPCGDDGPAASASFDFPEGVAVDVEGNVYVADSYHNRVRRISPGEDRTITTLAGSGECVEFTPNDHIGDGGPAAAAELCRPTGIAVTPDASSIYVTDSGNHRVRRVDASGQIETVAGKGWGATFAGDGGPATDADLSYPGGIALDSDGGIYVSDEGNLRVRYVDEDGIIKTVVGDGERCGDPVPVGSCGDGGLPVQALLDWLARHDTGSGLAVGPDGSLFLADQSDNKVRRVASPWPGFTGEEILIPSRDGRRLFVFDPEGRHLWTSHALTGAVTDAFLYDDEGRLAKILTRVHDDEPDAGDMDDWPTGSEAVDEVDYDTTTVARGASGAPTGLVAPFGQETSLTPHPVSGYLQSIANPAGESVDLTYLDGDAIGLLDTLTDPHGHVHDMDYEAYGRLARDAQPVEDDGTVGWKETRRTETAGGWRVDLTTAAGTHTVFDTALDASGGVTRTVTDPEGQVTTLEVEADLSATVTHGDGSVTELEFGDDPRWGMAAPYVTSRVARQPGPDGVAGTGDDKTNVLRIQREADLVGDDPLFLERYEETATLDPGPPEETEDTTDDRTSTFELTTLTDVTGDGVADRFVVKESPEGRGTSFLVDPLGRPTEIRPPAVAAVAQEPIRFRFDEHGRPSAVTQGTRDTGFAYYPEDGAHAGALESRTDPEHETTSVTAYDGALRPTGLRLPDGAAFGYEYTGNGDVRTLEMPSGDRHEYGFSNRDLLTSYSPPAVDAADPASSFLYDTDGRPTRATRPDGSDTRVLYVSGTNDVDRVEERSDPGDPTPDTTTLSHDPATGHLAGVSEGDGDTMAFGWEGSLLSDVTWGGAVAGTVAYGYDDTLRTVSLSVDGAVSDYEYDNDDLVTGAGHLTVSRDPSSGAITGTTLGDVTTLRSYDGYGEAVDQQVRDGATTLYDLDTGAATGARDANGRVVASVETVEGASTTSEYEYDAGGRLHKATRAGATVTYCYDGNGNRTARYEYDAECGSGGVHTAGAVDDQDRLLTYGTLSFTYTPNGDLDTRTDTKGTIDPSDDETTRYSYGPSGLLAAVELPDGARVDYTSDAAGNLVRRVKTPAASPATDERYLYADGPNPVAKLDASNAVVARYVYATSGHVPDYVEAGGRQYLYVTDRLGSPRLLVGNDGTVVYRAEYDAWGEVVSADPDPGFQPFGFAGGLADPDPGLVRFGARWYDPHLGRWITKDPIGQAGGANVYAYVGGDPINAVDPSGLWGNDLETWTDISNFAAGMGDSLSFGLTGAVREAWGYDHVVDRCSAAYRLGDVAGLVVGLAMGLGVALAPAKAAKALSRLPGIGRTSGLFGRTSGALNHNNVLRIGWSWKQQVGDEVLRIGVGPKRGLPNWLRHLDIVGTGVSPVEFGFAAGTASSAVMSDGCGCQ